MELSWGTGGTDMSRTILVLASGLGVLGAQAAALGDVTDIDDVIIDARNFNDYPNSLLTIVEDFPSSILIDERDFGQGGFANRHRLFMTADGANQFHFDNQVAFDISIDIRLDAGTAPGKETGFYFDRFGEPRFIIKGDGEVAAFDGAFPFFSFGNVYTLGDEATLRTIYTPGSGPDFAIPATIEYIYNDLTSGPLEFSNLENGMIDATVGGFYAQFSPDGGNPDDFAVVEISNVRIQVPAPGTLMGLMLVLGVRRRQR